jgi:hypothetical protein
MDSIIDLPGYNTDSDNDVSDFIPEPRWNYSANMPQDEVESILDEDAEMTRYLKPQIPLPPETKRLSVTLQSRRLKKVSNSHDCSL